MLFQSKSIRSFVEPLHFLTKTAAMTTTTTNPRIHRVISAVQNPRSKTLAPPQHIPLWRCLAFESRGGAVEVDREVDLINVKFGEAREEIEMALESKETVYFDEEAECARKAVREVLEKFESLLGKVKEGEREALRRYMGLKMEQLKAELNQLDD